jgi:hypothetical protein
MLFETVNYLFAAYLQTNEGGRHKVVKVEKLRPGKAKFFFELTPEQAEDLQFKFHQSICLEFEQKRRATMDLAY